MSAQLPAASAAERQCGRCRRMFDLDASDAESVTDWWVCSPCRLSLFGASREQTAR